jgi:histidinol phosphatase-like PHP family hydrolase
MLIFKEAIENLLAEEKIGRCDFHTHSFLSDGVLLPMEQLRRAFVHGHVGYGITDHVSLSTLDVIPKLIEDCKLATKHWGILALPGIDHGETIAEPVEPGTNLVAAKNKNVDILAHPGLLTKEVADQCKKNNVFVEITSNRTHSITNGHVAKIGKKSQVKFIQNTDTHRPSDMRSYEEGERILIASGFTKNEATVILQDNIRAFLSKIYERL